MSHERRQQMPRWQTSDDMGRPALPIRPGNPRWPNPERGQSPHATMPEMHHAGAECPARPGATPSVMSVVSVVLGGSQRWNRPTSPSVMSVGKLNFLSFSKPLPSLKKPSTSLTSRLINRHARAREILKSCKKTTDMTDITDATLLSPRLPFLSGHSQKRISRQ